MYSDTVTLFNFYSSSLGDMWYPTIIHNANLMIDKASIVAKYGAESKDNAILNIHYRDIKVENPEEGEALFHTFVKCKKNVNGGSVFVEKEWFSPKEWERQTNDKLSESITFSDGDDSDFFMLGDYGSTEPILDDDYRNGFYEYMEKNYDYVFTITAVAKFSSSTIPHFEIMGK